MKILKKIVERKYIVLLKDIPTRVTHYEGKPAELDWSDSSTKTAGCLRCTSPRCIQFSSDEISCGDIKIKKDNNKSVCPVNAISWDSKFDHPVTINDSCLGCGLCMKRCPVGALYYSAGKIMINLELSEFQEEVPVNDQNINKHQKQVEILSSRHKCGYYIREGSERALRFTYKKLKEKTNNQYHNLLVRNLLIGLGCKSAMPGRGDVATRMDAIYSSKDKAFGAVEVEFGRDNTLEASRGILDDIAVLNARHNIAKDNETPIVVCLELPNERQDYWQVVKDINKVTKVKINTISIGALLLLLWNNIELTMVDNPFYVDYDDMEIRTKLENMLGTAIDLPIGDLGILKPIK